MNVILIANLIVGLICGYCIAGIRRTIVVERALRDLSSVAGTDDFWPRLREIQRFTGIWI